MVKLFRKPHSFIQKMESEMSLAGFVHEAATVIADQIKVTEK